MTIYIDISAAKSRFIKVSSNALFALLFIVPGSVHCSTNDVETQERVAKQRDDGVVQLEQFIRNTPTGSFNGKTVKDYKLTESGVTISGEPDNNLLSIINSIRPEDEPIVKSTSKSTSSLTFNNDFNGDGCIDTANVFANRIEINQSCAGRIRTYNFSGTIAVNGVFDTDGEPGVEIVVVNAQYLQIVDDEDNRTRSYNIGSSWVINGHYETDGYLGNEIGIVSSPYFKMVNDKRRRVTNYRLGNSWAINGAYDADGKPGKEIGIVLPRNLTFIKERSRSTSSFYLGYSSWAINGHYETDGAIGEEIGIVRTGSFNLYDLRDYTYRTYFIPGSYFINSVQNINGQSGKEVLINNYSHSRNATIVDATNRITFSSY